METRKIDISLENYYILTQLIDLEGKTVEEVLDFIFRSWTATNHEKLIGYGAIKDDRKQDFKKVETKNIHTKHKECIKENIKLSKQNLELINQLKLLYAGIIDTMDELTGEGKVTNEIAGEMVKRIFLNSEIKVKKIDKEILVN